MFSARTTTRGSIGRKLKAQPTTGVAKSLYGRTRQKEAKASSAHSQATETGVQSLSFPKSNFNPSHARGTNAAVVSSANVSTCNDYGVLRSRPFLRPLGGDDRPRHRRDQPLPGFASGSTNPG